MTYSFLEEALGGIRSGTFFRIGYITELPVKAAYAKEGWKILKKTESTVRTGVNYGKIKSVVEEREGRSEVTHTRKNHIVPVQRGRIYQNTDTEQMYLRVFPTKKYTNDEDDKKDIQELSDNLFHIQSKMSYEYYSLAEVLFE